MSSGVVTLEAPLTRSGAWRASGSPAPEALASAPAFLRTRGMSRWHRPRSGMKCGPDLHVVFRLWCGQTVFPARSCLVAGSVPDGDLLCGTCEGRAVGAGQDERPGGPDLVFSPERLRPPARCPGSRDERLSEWAGRGSAGKCLACGDLVAIRASGGPFNGRVGPATHEPGPGLVPGCPFHAWRYLTVTDGGVVCICQTPQSEGWS